MAKEMTVREVSNGYVLVYQDPVEGEQEVVFTKFFQVLRFIKEYLKDSENN